jgi:ATP-dependent DNA helicase RecG
VAGVPQDKAGAGSQPGEQSLLDEPLHSLVGDRTAKVLAKSLDLHTVSDLLRHYPRRYAERGELTNLDELRIDEHVTVMAEVAKVTKRKMRQRRGSIVEVVVTDGRGLLTLTYFNQAWQADRLKPGLRALVAGKVGAFKGQRQLLHPDYQIIDDEADSEDAAAFAGALIPVYPAVAALASWQIAKCIRTALDPLAADPGAIPDPIPSGVRERQKLIGLLDAFEKVHRPSSRADVTLARKRLKWDEAFVLQVALARRRADARALPATPRPGVEGGLLDAFDARLPFTLTAGQDEVSGAIAADLASDHPMHRLLQGEVGSGKTVVALRAMLRVVDSGGQAALLAPTEVLAQQHHRSITDLLGPLAQGGMLGGAERSTRVALLTGSQGAAARRQALLDAASGDAGIVVGTHALIEDKVQFQRAHRRTCSS